MALGTYIPAEITYTRQIPTSDIKTLISHSQANDEHIEIGLAIAKAESDYMNVCNRESCQYGIGPFQIVQSTFDEQCEGSPYNINDNIKCGMKLIENGEYWRWTPSIDKWLPELSPETQQIVQDKLTLCSCLLYANRYIKLPPVKTPAEIEPNSFPAIGHAVLLEYNESHIGIITNWEVGGFSIREANFNKCAETFRKLNWWDSHIRGFFSPN